MADKQQATRRQVYREAILALPAMTRAIFLQHRVDGDDLASIATRHGLPAEIVAAHLAEALVAIDRALRAAGV